MLVHEGFVGRFDTRGRPLGFRLRVRRCAHVLRFSPHRLRFVSLLFCCHLVSFCSTSPSLAALVLPLSSLLLTVSSHSTRRLALLFTFISPLLDGLVPNDSYTISQGSFGLDVPSMVATYLGAAHSHHCLSLSPTLLDPRSTPIPYNIGRFGFTHMTLSHRTQ